MKILVMVRAVANMLLHGGSRKIQKYNVCTLLPEMPVTAHEEGLSMSTFQRLRT